MGMAVLPGLAFLAAMAARAEDLPAALVAAARLIPADADEPWQRRVCLPLRIAADDGPRVAIGTVAAGGSYSMATKGALVGVGPADGPAPPFARALLDAGAAERVPLRWFERRIVTSTGVPLLRDTGAGPGAPPPTPAPRDERVEGRADIYLATGPDASRFVHDPNDFLGFPIPRVETGGAPDAGGPAAAAPPGVFGPSKFCYEVLPARVLEYEEPVANPNGRRTTVAAILFHPDRIPSWITDHRVIGAFQRWMRPDEVRSIGFSDYGDGWRPDYQATRAGTRAHLVGQDGP